MSASLFGALAVVVLIVGAALPFAVALLVFDVRARFRHSKENRRDTR
jgi:hypothetical protein